MAPGQEFSDPNRVRTVKPVVVTDSACGLTPTMGRGWGIVVVPLLVSIDGVEYSENDLDHQPFYERLADGAVVSTSQPSPGDFSKAYEKAGQAGADRVISIHVGRQLSGTVNSARLAADAAGVSVEVVDTGTASMPAGLAVLAVAEALSRDPTADVDAVVAAEVAAQRNVFISLDPTRLAAGGRAPAFAEQIPVLSMTAAGIHSVDSACTVEEAVELMAAWLGPEAHEVTVWVGDGGATRLGDDLAVAVRRRNRSLSVRRYTVPPSIGANTGPTVGLVISPLSVPDLPSRVDPAMMTP